MNRRPSYASVVAAGAASAALDLSTGVVPAPRSESYHSSTSPDLDSSHGLSRGQRGPMTNSSSQTHPYMAHQASASQQDLLAAGSGPGSGSGPQTSQLAPNWQNDLIRNANMDTYGRDTTMGGDEGQERFLMPSYLQGSRYMARLVAKQEEKEAMRRDNEGSVPVGSLVRPERSPSSSGNLGGSTTQSHRGMSYEVVEARAPEGSGSRSEPDVMPLPGRWADGQLEVFADGTALRWPPGSRASDSDAIGSVLTDHAMPVAAGIYYFEVHVEQLSRGGSVAVGVGPSNMSATKLPGWESKSWGWHSDDGKKHHGQVASVAYSRQWGKNDTVGCGVNFWERTIFFTRNGHRLDDAFADVDKVDMTNFFPCIGMKAPGAKLLINLGQEGFKFDIESEVRRLRHAARAQYMTPKLDKLTSGKQDDDFLKELVAQFLRNGGYVETARAFVQEVQVENRALGTDSGIPGNAAEEDIDAAQRQQIRSAILTGDVEKAIRCTKDFYPQVLPDNPIIDFKLKCRRFLEMIRKTTEIQPEPVASSVSSLKRERARATLPGSAAGGAMDLDEPADSLMSSNGTSGATSSAADLQAVIEEGVQLRAAYGSDNRREIRDLMRPIMGIWAYTEPTKSKEVGYLFAQAERVKTAEELNGAILVSMDKSSVAAIERIAQQTDILIEEITGPGLPGAFINTETDILRWDL